MVLLKIPPITSVMSDNYWSQENMVGTGTGISSCAKIINNQLIFGAHDNFVYSLDPQTGKLIWKFKTNGVVYSTPAVYKNMIYAGSADGFVYALNNDGKLEWKFNVLDRIANTSLVVSDDKIFTGTDHGNFFVIDTNGRLLWRFAAGSAIRTTPALINDKIIFGSHDHNLYCLDEDGKRQWKFLTGGPMWTCPCIADKDGKLLWSLGAQIKKQSDDFHIYFGGFDNGFYCIDHDGSFVWKYHTSGPDVSGPEYENDVIYFGSSDGYLFALDAKEGLLKWKFKMLGKMGHSSPVVTNENIFICDYLYDEYIPGGNVYCLSKKGDFLWRFTADNAIVASPLIHKNVLFIGSWDGRMYAISPKKQEVLWKFKTLFDKLNFDISTAMKHIESEEEKSKQFFTIWKPETLDPDKEIAKSNTYGKHGIAYGSNMTLLGTDTDKKRFSYTKTESYKTKRGYDTKEDRYR